MNDISYKNWHAMSDKALSEHIGAFVKHHRMLQNKTQEELSRAAGISRSTLSILERGETVTVSTLIQVLRMLNLLYVLDAFTVIKTISPMAIVQEAKAQRLRARSKKQSK
ncbi:MAG: helix-turn-helix domain-containing protein [Bacteroidota bacterium]|jgi:transcriptional regulator with XRE-family HTH domain